MRAWSEGEGVVPHLPDTAAPLSVASKPTLAAGPTGPGKDKGCHAGTQPDGRGNWSGRPLLLGGVVMQLERPYLEHNCTNKGGVCVTL